MGYMAEENTASKTANTKKLTHNAKDDQTISAREDYIRYGENLPDNNFCNELIRDKNLETIFIVVESSFANPALNVVMT
jgi:hypothetical protein